MKKIILSTLVAASTFGMIIVDPIQVGMNPTVEVLATSIKLNAKKKTIYKGKTAILKLSGTKKKVKWSSSNKKIATISSKGKVTAKKAGKCTMTAKVSGKKYKCIVTVKNPILSKTSISLQKGKTTTLKVTGGSSIKWSTSNKKVATVNSKGKITTKANGQCYIYAKTSGMTLKCKVKVSSIVKATAIKLNTTSIRIEKGKSYTLKATISPSNTTNKTITWISSDPSIATVSNGKVTGKRIGATAVTAKTSNGKFVKCLVIVDKPTGIFIEDVKINHTSLSMEEGTSQKLTASVVPNNTTMSKKITWSTTNSSVATVSSDGTVKAISSGTAYIYATAVNGTYICCKVNVIKKQPSSIVLDKSSITLEKGTYTYISFSLAPTNSYSFVSWTSSDNSVVRVNGYNEEVRIEGLKAGTAIITAKTDNGKTATCQVTVINPEIKITDVRLNYSSVGLNVGETKTLIANIIPINTTMSKAITWSSSNDSVVIVSSDGTIKGINPGTAYVYAKASNGLYTSCFVTVNS